VPELRLRRALEHLGPDVCAACEDTLLTWDTESAPSDSLSASVSCDEAVRTRSAGFSASWRRLCVRSEVSSPDWIRDCWTSATAVATALADASFDWLTAGVALSACTAAGCGAAGAVGSNEIQRKSMT
jgi:hypothetical protein